MSNVPQLVAWKSSTSHHHPQPRTPIVLSAFRYSGRPENVALALCPQAMSRDPQHFIQPEMEASCVGVSAGASSLSASAVFLCRFCSVSRAADPHDRVSEDGDGEHRHTPVWTRLIPIPFPHFCRKLTECVRMVACAVWLSRFEAIQWKALSIVKLDTTVLRQYSGKHYPLSKWMRWSYRRQCHRGWRGCTLRYSEALS